MTTNIQQCDMTSEGVTYHLDRPIGRDGLIAEDLLVAFEPRSGSMTDAVRVEIGRWTSTWLTLHPGAIVVMGCNGTARNSARMTREARLQALRSTLAEFGVPEDRVRYTDEVLDLNSCMSPIPTDRGLMCIKVVRSATLDAAVLPISELFRSLPAAGIHEYASRS